GRIPNSDPTPVPRSTAFRYKGQTADPQKAGRELKVRAVLTGRVTLRGDTLNIQAELVDVLKDSQLWGQQYNRKISDLAAVQEEIAREISEKLRLRLTGEDKQRLARRQTANPEAYQLYLQGRHQWNRRTGEALRKSIEYYHQAIARDPGYALAYAGLADSYAVLPIFSTVPGKEAYPKAKAAAETALKLDETQAEAHATLGWIKTLFDLDWPGGEREYRRAIALNPNYPTAHHWYALHLSWSGRHAEALAMIKKAQQLDPLSPIIQTAAGWVYFAARQFDVALEQYRKALDLDPNFPLAYECLSWTYAQKGMFGTAVEAAQKAQTLGHPLGIGALGYAYACGGNGVEAQKRIEELKGLQRWYDIA
ncbi:MAG: tetratricopeptide repeat protein, partial [Chloroflexota bacterium]